MPRVFVALKNLEVAKSRLSVALSDEQRVALVRAMALDVVDVVLAGKSAWRLTAIAPASWQALLPRSPMLSLLCEEELTGVGLNELLREAMDAGQPDQALVVHGDLPFLDVRDVRAAMQHLQSHDLVLCPDSAGAGTNALGFRESAKPVFRFGRDSFAAHRRAAQARSSRWAALERPGFARDIDTPADLSLLLRDVAAGEKVGARTALWVQRYGRTVQSSLETQMPIRFPRPQTHSEAPTHEKPSYRSSADSERRGLPL
ncbi:MAG: 2-phospho-L-lactate guanylyltransferase [Pseudomonadota bacterium]